MERPRFKVGEKVTPGPQTETHHNPEPQNSSKRSVDSGDSWIILFAVVLPFLIAQGLFMSAGNFLELLVKVGLASVILINKS